VYKLTYSLSLNIFYLHTTFCDSRHLFQRWFLSSKLKNRSCVPDHALLRGWCVILILELGYDIIYLCIKFDNSSSNHFRDMVVAHQNLNSSHDLTTPLSEMVCYVWAGTCCCQSIYPIWSLLSLPTTKIRRMIQNIKNGVVWGS